MHSLEQATSLEKASGNLGTTVALTTVAALAAGPLSALLPVLANTLAADRQKRRVEEALSRIDETLHAHNEALQNLTDSQYKLVNEALLALLHTSDKAKIEYLRRAVANTLTKCEDVLSQEAVVLSRVIRDISADEANFILENFQYERVQIAKTAGDHEKKVLTVDPDSQEGLVVTGLISLGLLISAEPTWDDSGLMRFSSIVAKLLVLLSK